MLFGNKLTEILAENVKVAELVFDDHLGFLAVFAVSEHKLKII